VDDARAASQPPPAELSAADRDLLLAAAELRRPIAKAARVAAGNGLGYAIFGGLSIVFALPGFDVIGLLLGGVLLGVGLHERAQATRLLGGDPAAPLQLARGELLLLGALVLYAVLGLTVLPTGVTDLQRQIGNTKQLGIDIVRLEKLARTTWFGCMLGVSLLYQGGMARYFLRRRGDVARYLAEAPAWARTFVASMP
jgi:hypothetical protein